MSKIKIVFIHWALYMGGTQRQFVEMVQRLDRDRFEPQVLIYRDSSDSLQKSLDSFDIPVICLNFPKLRRKFHPVSVLEIYRLMRNMFGYLKRERPHIVQAYLPWNNICGALAAKMAGVPVIITGRRANIDERYMDFPKFPDQWLQDISNIWATAVVTNSHVVKEECLHREKYLHAQKIRVIYNGIDIDRFVVTIHPAAKKRELQIPENFQVVGIVASLHRRKGHWDFLKAAQQVLKSYPQTIFLIIGQDVGIRQELEAYSTQLGIRDSAIFTGHREDIPELLSILDIQVSASYVEGLSNSILEGMAAGKPVVATDIAGNSELVLHGQTGLLVPPGNPKRVAGALCRLLADESLRKRLGNAGQRRVEALFRIDHMVHQTEKFYQSLVC